MPLENNRYFSLGYPIFVSERVGYLAPLRWLDEVLDMTNP